MADVGQSQSEDIDYTNYWTDIHPNKHKVWRGMTARYYDCIDRELWLREVSQSPLGRRAWVVQERLLAPRVIHFGANQLFWECNGLKACELYPNGLPKGAGFLLTAELKIVDITAGYSHPEAFTTSED